MLRWISLFVIFISGCADSGGGAKGVFAKAAPSVVVVLAQDQNGEQISQGNGVIVGEGVAITNCHVVENAANVHVRQTTGAQAEAHLMNAIVAARDEYLDLCLLYAAGLEKPPMVKTAMGEATALSVGEDVYAIGTPHGLELSLSRGIVTQLRGDQGTPPIVQTDAVVSPRSSGGGLFNEKGELVGITRFGHETGGKLNLATPVEYVAIMIQKSRHVVKESKEQAALWQMCMANPEYKCVVELAIRSIQRLDSSLRDFPLSKIAIAQAKAGDEYGVKETLKIFGQEEKPGSEWLMTYIAIAKADSGDMVAAKQIAQQISDAYPHVLALGNIAVAEAIHGDTAAAQETIASALQSAKQMKFSDNVADDFRQFHTMSAIALAQIQIGDINEANKTAKKIKNTSWRLFALSKNAAEQAKIGDIDGAKKSAMQIDIGDGNGRTAALRKIAAVQYEVGDAKGAKQTLIESLRSAQQIADLYERAAAFGEIAITQAEIGDISGAEQTIADALPLAQKTYKIINERALRYLAIAQAKIGDIHGALRTAHWMRPVASDPALKGILSAQVEMGDISGAKQTLNQLSSPRLKYIVIAQAKVGDISGALQTAQLINDNSEQVDALVGIVEILAER